MSGLSKKVQKKLQAAGYEVVEAVKRKTGRMPMNTWKGFERRMCALFMAKRIPVEGAARNDRDGESACGRFDYQFKKRRAMSVNDLIEWLAGIRETAGRPARRRLGVLVVNRPGTLDAESLVVLQAADWRRVLKLLERGDALVALEREIRKRDLTVDQAIVLLQAGAGDASKGKP